MKAAAVYPETRSLGVVTDFPEPRLAGETSVKLRILSVGVCGTDREIASFDYGVPPEGSPYLVLGHEALGEVVEAGSAVEDLKPGDLVIPMVRRPCANPRCIACQMNRADFCTTGEYRERGIMRLHGFMTDFIVDEARYLNPVPASIRDVGVLVEPLTVAEKTLLQAAKVQGRLPWGFEGGNQNAVVLGAGPIGLLGTMALRLRGFNVTVYSLEREPNAAAEITKAIGGRYVSSQDRTVDQMAADAGPIDFVYEAAGSSKLAFDVLNVLGRNGLMVLTGVPRRHADAMLDSGEIMRHLVLRNQCMLGTVNAGKDAFENSISDLTAFKARWPGAVRALITGRFPIEAFAEPVLHPKGIKNIIEIAN